MEFIEIYAFKNFPIHAPGTWCRPPAKGEKIFYGLRLYGLIIRNQLWCIVLEIKGILIWSQHFDHHGIGTKYAKYLKFDWNSLLLLDTSLSIFVSKVTFVTTNQSIGAIFNITVPVIYKVSVNQRWVRV